MIVARQKPLPALLEAVGDRKAVLVAGCRGCVAVCGAGGEKEVGILAVLLKLAAKRCGLVRTVFRVTVHRQCDPGFWHLSMPLWSEPKSVYLWDAAWACSI